MVESSSNWCALEGGSRDTSHSVSNHKDKEPINSFSERFVREDAQIKKQDGNLGQVDGEFVYDLDGPEALR